MKNRWISLALGAVLGLAALSSWGQPATAPAMSPAEQNVRKLFVQRFGNVDIDGVSRTPYGLYEVRLGTTLLYTDDKVSYVLNGNLIDAASKKNVTRERMEQLLAVKFDELPLNLAVKQVRGDGSRRMAVFEDPNCGYCKQLRHSLQDVSNVTIYTFLYPILAPDSSTKARDVWCSSNPGQAWDDWMLNGKTPPSGNCNAPLEAVLALGKKLNVTGTPTIFFGDDSRVSGAIPAAQLRARLDSMSKKS
ncbi:thiol:disulfide interchange protein DsbC [Pigmentiphaga soli]|uniref:Thiol:disulfide interchange protein n=1 Tax=Pigmentiphaga soli TaxID=1007095 RepID=A0ABP8HSK4_9BURK